LATPSLAQPPAAVAVGDTVGSITRLDPAIDALIPPDAKIEVLGSGLTWAEGPIWIRDGAFLLFSDTRTNKIWRWDAKDGLREFLTPSGYTGETPHPGELGSNGLTLDKQGRLLLAQHGDRRIARLESKWGEPPVYSTIADKYEGKRFNSPNDLTVHSSGAVYFTDPAYGLPSPAAREIDFQGVYRATPDGRVTLLTKDLSAPNGVAFSPDEKTLYVGSTGRPAVLMAYPVKEDGTLGEGKTFVDPSTLGARRGRGGGGGGFDGLKVDAKGNVFTTGPGGVLVVTPEGKHLGTIVTASATANCAFGEDGSTLFITAGNRLLKVKTSTKGNGF
jgi:gluconolactonase